MPTTRNSCQWVALRILSYLGVTNLSAPPAYNSSDPTTEPGNVNYVTPGLLDDLAGIITASLQEIFDTSPASISEVATGVALSPPTTISVNVVQNSNTVIVPAGLPTWMDGCSILIGGDGFANEIDLRPGSSTNAMLRRPYIGATANAMQATVYGNAIALDPSIRNVLDPVEISGEHQLMACSDRAEFDLYSGCAFFSSAIYTGRPSHYFVETRYNPALNYLPTVLRIAKAPTISVPLTFRAKLNPPTVQVSDIGSSTGVYANAVFTDPGTMLPIPGPWVESILVPFCLQRLTGHALFKNEAAKPEIARQFQAAKVALSRFRPQSSQPAKYHS